jgi:hypothetical protein
MEAEILVADTREFRTKDGDTLYVLRDSEGNEYTTFREAIGRSALRATGKRVRVEYHEVERGHYRNVYLDRVELLDGDRPLEDRVAGDMSEDGR